MNMLRNRRDRLNSGSDEPSASGNFDALTASDAKKRMYDLWTANTRTFAAHSDLMVKARPLMRVEAKKLPGLQLFRSYPALGNNDIVSVSLFTENVWYKINFYLGCLTIVRF